AEEGLHQGELGPRVGAEPLRIAGDGLVGDAQHLLPVELVPRQAQDADLDRADGVNVALHLDVGGGAEEGGVADRRRFDPDEVAAVAQVVAGGDGAGAGDLLVAGQGDADAVVAGLVVEGLVPGDEGRRVPAGVVRRRGGAWAGGGQVGRVVDGENGQPVAEL